MENRRHFTRILFSIKAQLAIDSHTYPVAIHDISLNGALVTLPEVTDSLIAKLGILSFELSDHGESVTMHIAVIHQNEAKNELGLRCNAIDIDSMTCLRRMVELNLGDETQLTKELDQLNNSEHP